MFKSTKGSGMRRSGSSGSRQSGRISGMTQMRQAPTEVSRRRRPAFLPDTPEEQAVDSSTSRVSEVGESSKGYTGGNIGAR